MKTLCILIAVLFIQASMSEANNQTFEVCQPGVNNCVVGNEPGCCGPYGANRCCNFETNKCVTCDTVPRTPSKKDSPRNSVYRYYITKKSKKDDSFFVIENIKDTADWIEWYVKREPKLGNILFPSGIFSWKTFFDHGDGTVMLHDISRNYYSQLSSKGWLLKTSQYSDFWLYQEGDWSTVLPIEMVNATKTFEVCQAGVNNCRVGNEPGCCGPKGNNRCCNFETNKCVTCDTVPRTPSRKDSPRNSVNRYHITKKSLEDDSFFVIENIKDTADWIEWYVKREPKLGNILYPSAIFSWKTFSDNGDGTVTLHDSSKIIFSQLSSEGWFFKHPSRKTLQDSDFWLYQEGNWSTVLPIEMVNATKTFEVCQAGVNNCVVGNEPGCCGPRDNNRCCNFEANKCVTCDKDIIYYITKKSKKDDSFFVIENIKDTADWIEWYVKREPKLGNILNPSAIFSWKKFSDNGDGTVILHDSRNYYSQLSSKGWFLKTSQDSDSWLYQEGDWSTVLPIEMVNATKTFEVCQASVNNCRKGNEPGCCGPKGNNRCCNFETNKCVTC